MAFRPLLRPFLHAGQMIVEVSVPFAIVAGAESEEEVLKLT